MSDPNKIHRPGEGSTGPRTLTGKETSSRNAIVHGGRIEKHVILAHESEPEYQKLRAEWFNEYKPQTPLEADLLDHLAQRQWAFKRCQNRFDEVEARLNTEKPDFFAWTEADHRVLQLALRYRNAAERAYKSARAEIDSLRKSRLTEAIGIETLKRDFNHNYKTGMSGGKAKNPLSNGKPPLTPGDMPPGGWFCPQAEHVEQNKDKTNRTETPETELQP